MDPNALYTQLQQNPDLQNQFRQSLWGGGGNAPQSRPLIPSWTTQPKPAQSSGLGGFLQRAGKAIINPIGKFVNQGVSEAKQVGDTARMLMAAGSNNPTAFRNAQQGSQNNYSQMGNTGGFLNAGTATTGQEAQKGEFTTGLKKIGGTTAQVGSLLVPGAEGAGIAENAARAAIGGSMFGAGSAASQGGSLQDILKGTTIGGIAGGATGGALSAGGSLLSKIFGKALAGKAPLLGGEALDQTSKNTAIHLSGGDTYAKVTPEQWQVIKDEVNKLPFDQQGKVHLSPVNNTLTDTRNEVSLGEIAKSNPNIQKALDAANGKISQTESAASRAGRLYGQAPDNRLYQAGQNIKATNLIKGVDDRTSPFAFEKAQGLAEAEKNLGLKGSNVNKFSQLGDKFRTSQDELQNAINNHTDMYKATSVQDDVMKRIVGSGKPGEGQAYVTPSSSDSVYGHVAKINDLVKSASNPDGSISLGQLVNLRRQIGDIAFGNKLPQTLDNPMQAVYKDAWDVLTGHLQEVSPQARDVIARQSDMMNLSTAYSQGIGPDVQGGVRPGFGSMPIRASLPFSQRMMQNVADKTARGLEGVGNVTGTIGSAAGAVNGAIPSGTSSLISKFGALGAANQAVNKPPSLNTMAGPGPLGNQAPTATPPAVPTPPPTTSGVPSITDFTKSLANQTSNTSPAEPTPFGVSKEQIAQAMIQDLKSNGGKEFSKLNSLYAITNSAEKAAQPKKPTQTTVNQLDTTQNALKGLQDVQKAYSGQNGDIGLGAISHILGLKPLGVGIPGGAGVRNVNSAVGSVVNDVSKALGYTTSKADKATVLGKLPNASDNPTVAKAKIDALTKEITDHWNQVASNEQSYIQNTNSADALTSALAGAGLQTAQ